MVGDGLPRGGAFLGARRSGRSRSLHSVPEKGVSVTENAFGTTGACFAHRVPLKMRRVPQEAFLSTACIFGTREGPLRYRMPTIQPPGTPSTPNHLATTAHHSTPSTPVPNATKPEMGKALPAANLSNCQKRGGIAKAQPGMPPKSRSSGKPCV